MQGRTETLLLEYATSVSYNLDKDISQLYWA